MRILKPCNPYLFYALLLILGVLVLLAADLVAQAAPLDRVMTMTGDTGAGQPLAIDQGSTSLWQRLLKLRTTASALHTTAHPDDEDAGMLTYLSRGLGARTALLTLNRGEAGANAIGAELFDSLGLIRTEELRLAGRYYGLDDQYFTTAIDYGFSKTLDEALRSWDREAVLRDIVRILRINRPLVVVSRFHGSERDGHGHHQAVGVLTPEAVQAAGDPARFPEQITDEGLRPWQPLKLYRGGVHDGEPWHVRLDVGQYSPWLGASYDNVGMYGRSLQRSQTSGRMQERLGAVLYHYERLLPEGADRETGLFDGLDTSISGLLHLTGEAPPVGATDLLAAIEGHVEDAVGRFNVQQPSAVVPPLVLGLRKTRAALALLAAQPEAAFMLRIKERQFIDAIQAALGLRFTAVARPDDEAVAPSPRAPLPTMDGVVPGQMFRVEIGLLNPSDVAILPMSMTVEAPVGWTVETREGEMPSLGANRRQVIDVGVRVPEQPTYSERYFYRSSMRENHYKVRDAASLHLPARPPRLLATASFGVDGEPMTIRTPVRTREANLPYGYVLRELKVVPALVVNVAPKQRIVPIGREGTVIDVQVELLHNKPGAIDGTLRLEAPAGWQVEPAHHPFAFSRAGQRQPFTFRVTLPRLGHTDYMLRVMATADGKVYREGYDIIRQRDLETRYLYEPAAIRVRGLDVEVAENLSVGYVMGVGDDVPAGIEQLGAAVHLLTAEDLASGDLTVYAAVVVGTRAYAVRQDVRTYNARLLAYAKGGGNLIVLYQTPEFVPNDMAPYPALLPRRAEEVSEQDAPVTVLDPAHLVFHVPNRITPADFDDWVEQRGSKFFAEWDPAYTPLIETHDNGQAPQRGAWLTARYGAGYYTYFALAIHRQLPYAVSGAYRIFANLLSMGRSGG